MLCAHCKKNKAVTFHRVGGEIEHKGKMKEIKGQTAMCYSCIKKKTENKVFLKGPIITNPTIRPTGDPLEWVLNDE